MATRQFALNTEPHVAQIGDIELEFQAEVMGDDFMDAYSELREAQRLAGIDPDDLTDVDPARLRQVSRSLRTFLAHLMLPDSAAQFTRLQVIKGGKTLETFTDLDEAAAFAATAGGGARVVDAIRLPDRVLVELLEWSIELYSGGQRPPTSSGASQTRSPRAGRSGTGASPSRGSTRTRGR